jgi:hypothetical protein
MCSIYRGPLFQAFLELGVGARTDPDLAAHLVGAHEEMVAINEKAVRILFPAHADCAELLPLVTTGQATMRGLVLIGLTGDGDPDALWPTVRGHILALNALILDDERLRL